MEPLRPVSTPGRGRDLRLDFFRGLALVFIFLNHIPHNVASWLTNRNYGFSDATEIFVFLSGYSAMLAYAAVLDRRGLVVATIRVLRRVWQIYATHILLFVVYTAEIAWIAERYMNPLFADEMRIAEFLDRPHVVLIEVLLLKSRPANMDVLPLYVVLLLAFPLVLVAIRRASIATLAAALVLYVAADVFRLNLSAFPSGEWFFNPFAWQLLFVLGAWCASWHGRPGPWRRIEPDLPVARATGMILFAAWITATWTFPHLAWTVPDWLARVIYPINKTNLDVLRLLHFLAIAYLVVILVRPEARFLRWRITAPFIRCGQESLAVFCASIFLSFTAHFLLVEIDGSPLAQIGASLAGIAILFALAYALA